MKDHLFLSSIQSIVLNMTQQETTESWIWLTQYLIVFEFSEPEIQEKFKYSCFTVTNKSWKCFEFV